MAHIQVHIMAITPLLRAVVRRIVSRQPDIEVVDETAPVDALMDAPTEGSEVLIVGIEDGRLPAICIPLVHARPRLRVLALAGEGLETTLFEMRPHRLSLGNVSPETLLDAIRAPPARTDG